MGAALGFSQRRPLKSGPLYLCVFRKLVTISLFHYFGTGTVTCQGNMCPPGEAPESTSIGPGCTIQKRACCPQEPPAQCWRWRHRTGNEEEEEGKWRSPLHISTWMVCSHLNFTLCDQLKSQEQSGSVTGESTLAREEEELGNRKKQKESQFLNH